MAVAASPAYAESFRLGKDTPATSTPLIVNYSGSYNATLQALRQPLPHGISGNVGKFVFFSDASGGPFQCNLYNLDTGGATGTGVTSQGNGTGQQLCDFTAYAMSFSSTTNYALQIGASTNLYHIYGSPTATRILTQGFDGQWTSYALDGAWGINNLGGVQGATPVATIDLIFDASRGTSTPYFSTAVTSSRGVAANCGITDISGCVINALSWAFVPDESVWAQFTDISLASTSPFGYVYDFPATVSLLFSAPTTTTPFTITENFSSFNTLFTNISVAHGGATVTVATSSVQVFNACWADTVFSTPYYADYIMPFLRAALWIGFLFSLYLIAHFMF